MKPRGLSISDATLARNRFGARPMETVSPVSASIRFCSRMSCSAGGPPFSRSVPFRSIQASSSDRVCTSGVSSRTMPKMRSLSTTYFAKSGLITTASGQAFSALNIGIAEPTPYSRAT